ncbi:hypothetical protein SNOG_05934 [Parastagonospora nodorum SN15]|uniref:Uncharacterized protein n=1 Tax=Phaeosphaeria nodorum (strain SN15 / ATCC MYA-4574 / FGSC 10173) TaxID=321614 RepID=Q0UQN0_PHANO|nr:hypothetical protein SNOG_05934 [Parastagonospora nodorum SN15]EAT86998.1 hypothetical protein SNOG_05934 [Parastagonospora nodorum SN15]
MAIQSRNATRRRLQLASQIPVPSSSNPGAKGFSECSCQTPNTTTTIALMMILEIPDSLPTNDV